MTKIKICGLRRAEDIAAVNEVLPDFCGFVVEVPGRARSISRAQLRLLVRDLDHRIIPVGVFVNAPVPLVAELINEGTIAMAQLHGQEDEDYIRALRGAIAGEYTKEPAWGASGRDNLSAAAVAAGDLYPRGAIIKAFSIKTAEDVRQAQRSSADYILLDQGGGGTGRTFDWSVISHIDRAFFLAGGLSADNLEKAIREIRPWAVDLSSSLETDGFKDIEKMRQAVRLVRGTGADL